MNRTELNEFIESQFREHIVKISDAKGGDYAGDDDALANFKEQAKDWGLKPVQVWGVFAGKHFSAIKTFVKEGDVKSEPVEGRLHDMILYCFLLLALNKESGEPTIESIADTGDGHYRAPHNYGEALLYLDSMDPIILALGREWFRAHQPHPSMADAVQIEIQEQRGRLDPERVAEHVAAQVQERRI